MRKPIVGVTMGDAAGIGPEIILMALARREVRAAGDYVVYGLPEVMARAATLVGWKGEIREAPEGENFLFEEGLHNVVRCGAGSLDSISYGAVSARCGQLAFDAIKRAIEYAMLLMEGNFRVAHISTHVSLFDAIKAVKKERVATVIRLVHEALNEMGIRKPRIAVAGLNPYAGENGLFGREVIEEISPAVAQTASLGAVGPLPPDSVFSRAAGGEFDAVIAMYHDQGHIPLKMVGFRYCECEAEGPSISGINITLGSPVIRCSIDHGTAFNLAGAGSADPGSMATAMITAAEMAAGAMIRRKGTAGAGFIKE